MKREETIEKRVLVTKGDTFWIAVVLLALLGGYNIGVFAEKIGALEDIIFNGTVIPQAVKIAEGDIK